MIKTILIFLIIVSISSCHRKQEEGHEKQITLENEQFRLQIGVDGKVISLLHKPSGQECLEAGVETPAFTITQYRPYINEMQLAYPAKSITFPADSVYLSDENLIVNFNQLNVTATIGLKITEDYVAFNLKKIDYHIPKLGDKLHTPIDEFTILQLPVRNRDNFGEWLNVAWDNDVAINVLATDPYAKIDNVKYKGYHLLTAGTVSEVKTLGVGAALITTSTNKLTDCIDRIEKDFNLPRGVESRRRDEYKYSYLELSDINPKNVDEYIAFAKQGGFRAIDIYWPSFSTALGHFPWGPEYPNGMADLQEVVRKIKQANIIAGFHTHYNKALKQDLYVSPVPDHRLNLSRNFTLAVPLDKNGVVVTVEEDPSGCTLDEGRRILKIGDELIEYTGYTTDWPYQFTGCKRGALDSKASEYKRGYKFGLLDIDTWPIFVRFDQKTSIQKEMAERIGKLYQEAGFQFIYFDGAEDIPPPYWYNGSNAQLEVYKSLSPEPLFSEGALKTHFSWHILTRGNAFDVFKPEVLKEAIRLHPADEAVLVAKDFTAINFGWINYVLPGESTIGSQPDMYEYAWSRAAAWDCPASLVAYLDRLKAHPRTNDNLEVIRRWEEARITNVFTPEQKEQLKNLNQEYILLVNEAGEFEMCPYDEISGVANADPHVRAFIFDHLDEVYVVFWHTSGEGSMLLDVNPEKVKLYKELGKAIPVKHDDRGLIVPVGDRQYLGFNLPKKEVISILKNVKLLSTGN
ncbi:MAG: hypothetical protein ABFD10_21985 [Prolixibacteraceae bacterium]